MKETIISILAALGIGTTAFAGFGDVYLSRQVGTSPTNGYVLQTDGTNSTWVATSTLGIVGGSGSGDPFAWTPQAWGNSTSTVLGFLGGFLSQGSSTAQTLNVESTLTVNGTSHVGTVGSGTWNGSVIGSTYGGAGSVSGILKANGSGTVSAASNGTDYSLISANTCSAGSHFSQVAADGTFTCSADTGNGTVSSGNASELALYASTGTTVSGTSTLTISADTFSIYPSASGGTSGFEFYSASGESQAYQLGGTTSLLQTYIYNDSSFFQLKGSSNNDFMVYPAGTSYLYGSGNFGIGTKSPTTKLDVLGTASSTNLRVAGTVTLPSLTSGLLYSNASGIVSSVSTSTWSFASSTLLANNNTWSGTNAFGVLSATYASTTQIGSTGSAYFATSGGNVGVGTTSPTYKLSVVSDTTNKPAAIFTGGSSVGTASALSGQILLSSSPAFQGSIAYDYTGGDFYLDNTWNSDNGDIFFRTKTAGTPVSALTIKGSGNIGIGTTTANAKLTTWGTGSLFEAVTNASTTVFSIGQNGATTTALAISGGLTLTGSASNIALGSNYLSGDGGDEGVYVDSTGRVGLGTTTPGSILSIQNVANFVSSAVSTIYNGLNIMTTLIIPNSTTQSPTASAQIAIDTTSYQVKYGDGSTTRVLGNGYTYPAFSYATTTTWTGTTTIPLGTAFVGETWSGLQCFTDAGTLQVSIHDGTNRMNWMNASTTVGTVLLSTNNTFTAAEKRYVDVGTPATSPTKISCTVRKAITAD